MVVDTETGEVMNSRFAKLFFDDISLLYGLSGTQMSVFVLMVKSVPLGTTNSIMMTPKRKKQFAQSLGMKTHQQVTNSLNALVSHGVIKKVNPGERFDYEFMVNPLLSFGGNDYQRAKIIIDYTDGERNVVAVVAKDGEPIATTIQRAIDKQAKDITNDS